MSEKDFELKFNTPDVWNLDAWNTYHTGRQEYIKALQDKNKDAVVSNIAANYYGSIALVKAGIVHILDIDDELKDKVKKVLFNDDPKKIPLPLIGKVINEISNSIEAALDSPLELSLIEL